MTTTVAGIFPDLAAADAAETNDAPRGAVTGALGARSVRAVAGGLIGHGVSTSAAQGYETAIASGKVQVAVHTRHDRAKAIASALRAAGGAQVADFVHFSHVHEAGDE